MINSTVNKIARDTNPKKKSNNRYFSDNRIKCIKYGLLLEDEINSIFPENTNLSKNRLAEVTSLLIDYIYYRTKEYSTPIISREEFSFYLEINKTLVGYGLRIAKRIGVIDVSRKGTVNGTNIFILDLYELNKLEKKGKNYLNNKSSNFEDKRRNNLNRDIEKIIKNKTPKVLKEEKDKNYWSKKQTEAINKMAYASLEEVKDGSDPYHTGLSTFSQITIQFISKTYYKYNYKPLEWNYYTFNKIIYALLQREIDISDVQSYESELAWRCIPQKLIDTVKFVFSKYFRKITKCESNEFGIMFMDAYNRGLHNISRALYKDKVEEVYSSKNIENYENKEYYKSKVDINKKIKLRAFNNINSIDINDYWSGGIRSYLSDEDFKEAKIKQEENIQPKEDPCALFKSLK